MLKVNFCSEGILAKILIYSLGVNLYKYSGVSYTWGDIQGFAQANGGIAFQTCISSGYLVNHYEPA